jgi:anhydro-N-acetylmuramic acid kinase
MPEFRTAIGLMSGTSLDGVDVALLTTDGKEISAFGPARTYPYAEGDRQVFRQAFRDALSIETRRDRPGVLPEAEALVTQRHAAAVEAFFREFGMSAANVDLVGFHGQTVLHDPARALTVQLGNGQALADRLYVPVVWDFRAADIASGGQGAPLAPVFHRALAEKAKLAAPVVFLNIGGVANVTYVGSDGALIAFDTGPGNALLDDWMFSRTGQPFDKNGRLAAAGTSSHAHLAGLLDHPYFSQPPPKSLDRNAFALAALADLSDSDGAATLLQFSARTIAGAVKFLPEEPRAWYACGGGRHNVALMRAIADLLPGVPVKPLEALGFDGDATEAQAFAFLAVRTAEGMPISFPMTTGVRAPLPGGILSRPGKASLTQTAG